METLFGGTKNTLLLLGGYCLCTCYNAALQTQNAMMTRVWHIVIFLLYVLFGWVNHNYSPQLLRHIPSLGGWGVCPEETCSVLLINRLSLAIFVFHLILAAALFGASRRDDPRASFQNQCWGFKFLLLTVLIIGSAFVQESFFSFYGWLSVLGAFTFIIIEIWILANMGHKIIARSRAPVSVDWSRMSPEKYHETVCLPSIVISTILLLLGSLALIIYALVLFERIPDCSLNFVVMGLWLSLAVLVCIISVCGKLRTAYPDVGAFGGSIVMFYMTYLLWNASVVDDPGQCTSQFVPYGTIYWITVSIGTGFALVLIIYSSLTLEPPRRARIFYGTTIESGSATECLDKKIPIHVYNDDGDDGPPPNPQDSYNYSKINFFFALATMYICMLLTNWSVIRRYQADFAGFNQNGEAPEHHNGTGERIFVVEMSLGWVSLVADITAALLLVIIYVYFVCRPYLLGVVEQHQQQQQQHQDRGITFESSMAGDDIGTAKTYPHTVIDE